MVSSITGAGKTGHPLKKNEMEPYITRRINSKCMKDLRPETVKLLEESKGKMLLVIGLENGFLDMSPKSQATKPNETSGTILNEKALHSKGNKVKR